MKIEITVQFNFQVLRGAFGIHVVGKGCWKKEKAGNF